MEKQAELLLERMQLLNSFEQNYLPQVEVVEEWPVLVPKQEVEKELEAELARLAAKRVELAEEGFPLRVDKLLLVLDLGSPVFADPSR